MYKVKQNVLNESVCTCVFLIRLIENIKIPNKLYYLKF